MAKVYDEIIEFIATGTTPETVAAFRPSDAARERVAELIQRQKEEQLSAEESTELNHCLLLEHIMRLAKARARQQLSKD